jgi:hypothetical protein
MAIAAVGLLGTFAVASASGPATAAEPSGPAAPPPATMPFTLSASVPCQLVKADGTQSALGTGTVALTGTLPASLPAGARTHTIAIDATASATLPTPVDLRGAGLDATVDGVDQPVRFALDGTVQHVVVNSPAIGPVAVRLASQWLRVATPDGSVECYLTGALPEVKIPLALPADGSLQFVDMSGTYSCDIPGQPSAPVTLRFLAPTRVEPGAPVSLRMDLSSPLRSDANAVIAFRFNGVDNTPSPLYLPLARTQPVLWGQEITTGPAQLAGTVVADVLYLGVTRQAFPSGIDERHCVPPAELASTVSIAIASPPPTSTSTSTPTRSTSTTSTSTTSTTRSPGSVLCPLRPQIPDWLWQLLVRYFGKIC